MMKVNGKQKIIINIINIINIIIIIIIIFISSTKEGTKGKWNEGEMGGKKGSGKERRGR